MGINYKDNSGEKEKIPIISSEHNRDAVPMNTGSRMQKTKPVNTAEQMKSSRSPTPIGYWRSYGLWTTAGGMRVHFIRDVVLRRLSMLQWPCLYLSTHGKH